MKQWIVFTFLCQGLFLIGCGQQSSYQGSQAANFNQDRIEAYYVVALGDSISAGTNATGAITGLALPQVQWQKNQQGEYLFPDVSFFTKPDYSWVTGRKDNGILSHYERIKEHFLKTDTPQVETIEAINYARHGYTSTNLMRQVDRLKKLFDGINNQGFVQHRYPNYIAMTIGINDICKNIDKAPANQTIAQTFETEMRKTLIEINSLWPDAKVFMSLMPDFMQMREIMAIKEQQNPICKIRNMPPFIIACSKLTNEAVDIGTLSDPNSLVSLYDQAYTGINAAITSLGSELDHVKSMVYYDGLREAEGKIKLEQISDTDCFHPNIMGQNEFARVNWDYSWF